MKFFVPSSFGKNADAVKFKPTAQIDTSASGKIKKNKKKKNKAKPKTEVTGRGPLAPPMPMESDDDETMTAVRRVKEGKVEKKKNNKKQKQKQIKPTPALLEAAKESLLEDAEEKQSTSMGAAGGVSAFEAKLKEQLMGGRFRFLNEQLYTMNSKKAEQLFKSDPEAFKAYHDGYRHQVEKWPLNPLNRIIKMVKKLPKSLEIGDFGCGEGMLAKSVPHKVYSMDLVSCRDDIISCDMANTPLNTQSLDVAVYCLSLMGTNLKDYLLEANRVLKMDGLMYVAEIQSRFDNVKDFVRKIDSFGFTLLNQDVGQKVFYFFQFKKVRNVGKVANVPALQLKPCLYRKR
ncbi:ribosomal RNA-processing protein 8 [Musca domestica]|uniref:Ribosomal RNA-processing protein 8 n=1 Tax=Musca domestica TaxID=7370 RepID=A0A9J7I120_MUSDO|nr:ribosomal RNA-processing protein 8 [Musca domestica]